MLAQLKSATLLGLSVHLVEIEVDAAGGLPSWDIVGLPDTAVKESKERVRTAIKNAGYDVPPRRIVVNLAPAYLRKEGPSFDLAIAIAILAVTEQLHCSQLDAYLLHGGLEFGRLPPSCKGYFANLFRILQHRLRHAGACRQSGRKRHRRHCYLWI